MPKSCWAFLNISHKLWWEAACRKAWKSFVKSFASQSSEEGENDEAVLTDNSFDAPQHMSAVTTHE